ncbi:hypothetical protein [Streptomyces solincola]|uniref:hypothetical protein n=1 Tax=Streptomyces solincola TaxID=2100817 RepID=UPI0015E29D1A|nr:hypothetical protein [Streptomyces solincola]
MTDRTVELSADLSAAARDDRDPSAYMGGDVERFAASRAIERGLITPHPASRIQQGQRPSELAYR